MTADDAIRVTDVRWMPAGAGHMTNFRCGRCAVHKQTLGRRLRRVKGVRQWCCKACVAIEGAKT